jgi:hypothetical protein
MSEQAFVIGGYIALGIAVVWLCFSGGRSG